MFLNDFLQHKLTASRVIALIFTFNSFQWNTDEDALVSSSPAVVLILNILYIANVSPLRIDYLITRASRRERKEFRTNQYKWQ